METKNNVTFEEIFKQNERRIHYHLHKLNINDPHRDFYQEGLCAMWNAYETYQPDKGPMATYFNYIIRNRLIDLLRKQTRESENVENTIQESKTQLDDGNHHIRKGISYPITPTSNDIPLNDPTLWKNLKSQLTENQWKWIYYYIIGDMSVKDIAIQENTTVDAVKGWGKQVRKKLRDEEFRKAINWNPSL